MPAHSLNNANAKPTARRLRANRAFLTLCLAVTSLSALALAVLLLAIILQGTRSLFGFQAVVLPSTENTIAIEVEPERQRIQFLYTPDDPDALPDVVSLHAPVTLDLTDATITRDGDTALLNVPDRDPIRVGDAGSVFARLAILGAPDPKQPARFLTGDPSLRPSDTGFRAPLIGSLWILAVCALAAIPLGVGTAIVLEEFSPRARVPRLLHAIVQTNIRNLAGVPSVVYGLIGLTAFARIFGLFGNPGQFTDFESISTSDGQQIVGQVIEDRSERTFAITTDFFGTVQFDETDVALANTPTRDAPIAITGTIDLNENFEFVITTNEAGTLVIDAALANDLDQSVLFEDPFQTRTLNNATLTFVGEGELIVQTPDRGLVSVEKSNIDNPRNDRDRYLVRKHTYTLKPGATPTRTNAASPAQPIADPPATTPTTLTGRAVDLDGNQITLFKTTRAGDAISFTTDDIDAYTPHRRFQIGDEDTPFFIALPLGTSVLAGGLTLMLVVLPVVIIASQESLKAVPNSHREGALALGATKLQMIFGMTLPAAVPGIMTGSILSMSRAIGEAAPILIIGGAGFITFTPDNLMSGFAAMPLQIYAWTSNADREFRLVAASGIIVLLTVLFLFNAAAVLIRAKLQKTLT